LAGRLTIIGGGVMGLMTAYQAAPPAEVADDEFILAASEGVAL
jgi:glycine/D-amino acid oxidase-like deaminating enzyme